MATDPGQHKESPKKRAGDLLKNADRLLKAGQHKEALQDVEQALELDPRNAFALAYQQRIKSLLEQAPKTASTTPTSTSAPVPVPPAPAVEAPKVPVTEEVKETQKPAVDPEEAKKPIRKLAAIMFTDIVGYTALTQKMKRFHLNYLKSTGNCCVLYSQHMKAKKLKLLATRLWSNSLAYCMLCVVH